ncbi:hypothetical protein ACFXC8_24495 [Streptomyces sp. NPDC059441]|uniref:hypothetical protein n=1 Tax=Streptomyces sp. NPDC059441 TaxID=3346829 RepID=UPI0036C4C0A0
MDMVHVWVVRAGRGGERAHVALREGLAIAGWSEVGDLTQVSNREQMRTVVAEAYPDLSPQVIGNWTGQLWRFREEIALGDLVVTPVGGRRLAAGRVTSPYQYRADADLALRHVRKIRWVRTDIDRDTVQPDLRDSLGSLLTVFELSRNEAAERMVSLAERGVDPGSSDASPIATKLVSPERLEEFVQESVAEGGTVRLTIRELLRIWGHSHRRLSVVDEIQADLDALGLSTSPPFSEGSINSTVTVVPVGVEPESGIHVPTAQELPTEVHTDDQPVTFRVRQLPSADIASSLASVGGNDELSRATTLMVLNNFSQLPILDSDSRLVGAVSWETIGMAYLSNSAPTLTDATTQAREVDGEEDLLDWIPEIYRLGYIFVRDAERRITGIITTADLTSQLGSQLRPFLLVAEIERRLRRIIDRALHDQRITLDQIRSQLRGNRRARVHEARDLTLGEYPWILESQATWDPLGWGIDQSLFVDRLRAAAVFRNDLMHLNPDLDAEAEDELLPLRGLLTMLRALDW